MIALNALVDWLFISDIVLNFFTTYIDSITGHEVLNHRQIIVKYLKLEFWIDIVASLPVENFLLLIGTGIDGDEKAF